MKAFLLIVIISATLYSNAQITDAQRIADSSFGWMKIYNYKGVKTSRTLNDKVFSPAQLSLCDSFSNWIQASYIPKGCIGDIRRMIGPADNIYNPTIKYQPQIYGTTAYTWSLFMENGKPKPIQETEIPWGITANEIPGNLLKSICTGGEIYFFMEEKNVFEQETPQKIIDLYNIKTLPRFKNYHTLHSTASRYDRNAGIVDAVLLCKDNKLPFIPVTVEELINRCELMIKQAHEEALQSIKEKNKSNQKNIDYFTTYENDNYNRALKNFAIFKERYKNQGNQQAMLPSNFDYVDFYNGQDIFRDISLQDINTNYGYPTYPVYKLAPGTKEMSKQDKPLWVRVTWNWTLDEERMRHMHESIIGNFNFQYLYDFIFEPDKVRGLPYKPLRSPYSKEIIVAAEKSNTAKKAAQDNSIHFFEDFSGNNPGQKPADWFSKTNSQGSYSKVVNLPGAAGKWLEVKGHSGLIPNHLKKPLPADFELSFDIAVPKDFTWGAKAFELYLGTSGKYEENGKRLLLRLKPGFDGRSGETSLDGNFGDGYFGGQKSYYDVPGFSNNLPLNGIHVALLKKGETLTYSINGSTVTMVAKAMPASTSFNWLQFTHIRSDSETQKYFLGNVKILKQ